MVQEVCAWIFVFDYVTRIMLVGSVPTRLADCLPKGWEDQIPENDMDEDFRERMRKREDPELHWLTKTYKYACQNMNLIDLLAILPFLVEKAGTDFEFNSNFIRMLRLARVFRIFKIGKNNASINLLGLTLSKSLPALMLMGFFLALGVIIFGSTMYICEGGVFKVTDETPAGAFIREDLYGSRRSIAVYVDSYCLLLGCHDFHYRRIW